MSVDSQTYSIAIITNLTGEPLDELKAAAVKVGIKATQVTTKQIDLTNFYESDFLKSLKSYDAVYYRTGMRDFSLLTLINSLEGTKPVMINAHQHLLDMHMKSYQAILSDYHDIKHPRTICSHPYDFEYISKNLGIPFVVKPNSGSKGRDVKLINSEPELAKYFENARKTGGYVFQAYIENAVEYRAYTVGDKTVATYKKSSGPDDFRANIHAGGSIETTEPELEKLVAEFGSKVAKAFGTDITGTDILVKDNECMLLEVNTQPGWSGTMLKDLTGVDFPLETMKYIVNKIEEKRQSTG